MPEPGAIERGATPEKGESIGLHPLVAEDHERGHPLGIMAVNKSSNGLWQGQEKIGAVKVGI